ncbi:DMT family transporter [Alphaproteobacteria bacterium KMM 3653]|uniref:DMT family transporter n=1 Tax=Harenicola maris TaxID=2841044 RepID=A0AAP2CLU9_9RHOB|nr:DMT family transporter [Harenicola maris]
MQTTKPSRPLAGILWMVVTGLLFVLVTAIVKSMDGRLPAAQAAFLRYLFGLVFLVPMLPSMMRVRLLAKDWWLFGLRGLTHSVGVILWFFAMSQITLAEVSAMNYLSPVYVTLGAAAFLGEKLAVRRLAAVGVALIGMLVILRPGLRVLEAGHYAMIGTAILFAVSYLVAKRMSERFGPAVIVGFLSVTVTIGLAPFALSVWVTPSWADLGLLAILACLATGGHYTMTLAFAAAPVAVTQPVTYLQLVWAVLLGAVFFDEALDIYVILGGSMIIGAVSFIAWREAAAKRRQVTPGVHEPKV